MALKSKPRPFRRLFPLAIALVLAALVAIPSSGVVLAQTPPGGRIVLVNADRDFVERKGGGEFVARPVFDRNTSGALVVILGWMGLSFIVAEHLGTRQAGWREMVPRLVLGLVAAASSLWWCALVLDVADAVSGFIAVSLDVTPGDLLRSTLRTLMTGVQAGSVGMALLLAVLYLVYGFFVLYVIVQMVLRLALIDILLALAPIALGLWILPHTAGWGRHWLRLFMRPRCSSRPSSSSPWPWASAS